MGLRRKSGTATRARAYLRALRDFLDWAEEEAGIGDLLDIEPVDVAGWVKLKTQVYEAQSNPSCNGALSVSITLFSEDILTIL
jgi:hypothetical protein